MMSVDIWQRWQEQFENEGTKTSREQNIIGRCQESLIGRAG
jgi:hypothetical protein